MKFPPPSGTSPLQVVGNLSFLVLCSLEEMADQVRHDDLRIYYSVKNEQGRHRRKLRREYFGMEREEQNQRLHNFPDCIILKAQLVLFSEMKKYSAQFSPSLDFWLLFIKEK